MKRTMRKRKIIIVCVTILLVTTLLPVIAYEVVALKTKDRIYNNVDSIPYREVGMVLGTGPTTVTGHRNSYFYYRLDAAEELYKAGKVKYLLISGDNSRKDYSEPDVMKDTLIARGIPAEVIYLDYAGFRTLDSVVRSKKVFDQTSMTVISQRFHDERSIILGDWQDMDLIAFEAKETSSRFHKIRAHIREGFARVKLCIDMLIGKEPKFLGEPIEIGEGKIQKEVNNPIQTANNIKTEFANGLIIYYPQYTNIDLVAEQMPNPKDQDVLMCCEAAFTGQLLDEFKHSNIAGNHVCKGKLFKGYGAKSNTGCFAFYADDHSWKFAMGKYNQHIQAAADRGGMAFGQSMMIYNGVIQKVVVPKKPTSKNEYRALAELNGILCIIDSDGIVEFQSFVQSLKNAGVKHALYLDMGAGWNFSYYRDNNNNINYIHRAKTKYATNWIVFKK